MKRIALTHVAALTRKIAELAAMRDALAGLAASCHGDQRPECPILADLGARPGARQERPGACADPPQRLCSRHTNLLRELFGGWPSRAAFFVLDDDPPHHSGLEARLAAIVGPSLAGMGYDLVRVAVLGTRRPTVQIMAERADEAAMSVEDCEAISHAIGAVIDVEDPMPANWVLEISSPGIDRPLTRRRDWNRYAGHQARIELEVPQDGRRRATGIALGADATHARLRLDDGTELAVPLDNIRRAKLVLTDALIDATATPYRPN